MHVLTLSDNCSFFPLQRSFFCSRQRPFQQRTGHPAAADTSAIQPEAQRRSQKGLNDHNSQEACREMVFPRNDKEANGGNLNSMAA